MICDLAEFYNIYDYKSFSVEYIATLCIGFPSNARTIKKINNGYSTEELLLANIVDRLSLIWWSKTEDGQNNVNRPKLLIGSYAENKSDNASMTFESGDDYEEMRQEIIKGKNKNG